MASYKDGVSNNAPIKTKLLGAITVGRHFCCAFKLTPPLFEIVTIFIIKISFPNTN